MVTITYNGRSHNALQRAMHDPLVEGIREMINKELQPFQSEITSCRGTVTNNASNDLKSITLFQSGLSDQLTNRITSALSK
jgi:hypothetical protein